MVVGVVRPESGTVTFQRQDVTPYGHASASSVGHGHLTQEPSVFRKLTVAQNILAILETCRLSRLERQQRLNILLEELI